MCKGFTPFYNNPVHLIQYKPNVSTCQEIGCGLFSKPYIVLQGEQSSFFDACPEVNDAGHEGGTLVLAGFGEDIF